MNRVVVCPFCGMPGEIPHETQEACIAALQAEIVRTRQVLETVTEPLRAPVIAEDEERHAS